jgi:hypothetical protein
MRTDPRPDEVRELVVRVLEEFGARLCEPLAVERTRGRDWYSSYNPEEGDGEILDETILIDQGRYVARSYRADGFLAMWMVELGIVQFYNADGEMLATVNLFRRLTPQRMAA